eukprot:COSAG06_NODE_1627_length_8882_cov_9.423659_5_plen_209_part_00
MCAAGLRTAEPRPAKLREKPWLARTQIIQRDLINCLGKVGKLDRTVSQQACARWHWHAQVHAGAARSPPCHTWPSTPPPRRTGHATSWPRQLPRRLKDGAWAHACQCHACDRLHIDIDTRTCTLTLWLAVSSSVLRIVHRAGLLVVRPEGEARLTVKPQAVLVDGLVVRARDDAEINRDTSGVSVIWEGVMVARIAPLHSSRNDTRLV